MPRDATQEEVDRAFDGFADGSIVLSWTPESSRPRRIRLEPRAMGGWTRIEEERTDDDAWRVVGEEIVADVELEAPAAVVSDRLVTTYRGP